MTNNILILGNGFDIDHFNGSTLEGMTSLESLAKYIYEHDKYLYNKLEKQLQKENRDWGELEQVEQPLDINDEEETKRFLEKIKAWAKEIDEKCCSKRNNIKTYDNFQTFLDTNNPITFSFNYTDTIKNLYNIGNNEIIKLHYGNLPYFDFGNNYDPSKQKKAILGIEKFLKEIKENTTKSEKIANLKMMKETLYKYLSQHDVEINLYIYGAKLEGSDFKYFEEIFEEFEELECYKTLNIFLKRDSPELLKKITNFVNNNKGRNRYEINKVPIGTFWESSFSIINKWK